MGKKTVNPARYKNRPFLIALGDHCRRLRLKKGYSIDRMYKEGDKLSPGAIQRLETGSSDVHVSLLYRYAQVLEVPVKRFFEFERNLPSDSQSILIAPFEINEPQPPQTVPYYSLDIAAGLLERQTEALLPEGWVTVEKKGSLKDYFAAVVRGHSMEPTIPSGSLCLFKTYTGGSRNGLVLLVQARGLVDPESGGRFVIKRYKRITPVDDSSHRTEVVVRLLSDNKNFAPIELRKKTEDEISTPALFIEVISKE